MSSRRKSRPVRRLDMICSMLQDSGGIVGPPNWTDQDVGGEEDAVGSPEMPDDVTHTSGGSPASEIAEDHHALDAATGVAEPDNTQGDMLRPSTVPKPPEGVYVLQPESVSDDEEMCQTKMHERISKISECRKRSHEEEDSETAEENPIEKTIEPYSGLDLSVKRPRIDGTSADEYPDYEKVNNSTPLMQSTTSPNLFLENVDHATSSMNGQLEKYHQLMRLVGQQTPLAQAMEEVGLTVHEFFALHRINSQLGSSKMEKDQTPPVDEPRVTSAPPTPLSSAFDKFSSKGQHVSLNLYRPHGDDWTAGKAKHDAKIQNLLKEAKEDVIQQQKHSNEAQQLNNSRLQQQPTTLNPTMAAALMASLASNPDQTSEEHREGLRKIFLKAQGVFAQNTTPSKAMDSFNSTSNSPSFMDRSNVSKNDSITAGTVSSGVGSIKRGTLDPSNFDEDVFDQYIAKFTNMSRCGLLTCQYYTRDHYHCVVEDCNYQRFTNKADVIRHYNMHKKRDNSLAHGFLRFSPTEDCSSKYGNCHLNGKSTHYHCMQPDCNKVYTSTSDVMTHENFHKKYMQFVCSGFKRFRATEHCDLTTCQFRNQKTTHFHCTRKDCYFTFKNKCDIEKHKTYHLRDDQYISKGFKKFYKNETCSNNECVWNYTANHFHCLRSGCNFSFTSTSQMESHKRKHDRNEYLGEDDKSDLPSTSGCLLPPASASVVRKPDPPMMSHYKLPPKKLKFTSSIPPSSPCKDPTRLIPISSYTYPTQSVMISPARRTALSLRPGTVLTPTVTAYNPTLSLPTSQAYLPHSLLSPFSPYAAAVASRFVGNNALSVSNQNSPKMQLFNPALFQEAAKKILASMPAASLPHVLGASTPSSHLLIKSEPTQYSNVSRSEPVSPTTPLGSRSYTNYDSSQASKEKIKEEQAWNISKYGDSHMSTAASASFHIRKAGGSPVPSSQRSTSLLEPSHTDWSRSSSVISPSMAISAAAALKPITTNTNSSAGNGSVKMEYKTVPVVTSEEKPTVDVAVRSNLKTVISKYFAGAEPYKCWIADCDFFTKRHVHCLVENCEAMFTAEDNVIKHARFHENLESMGATLPIQSITSSAKRPVTPKSSNESDPPPGYIALQSRMPKPNLAEYIEPQQAIENSVVSPNGTHDDEPSGDDHVATERTSEAMFLPNGLTLSQSRMSSLASQIYANALLKGSVSESNDTPLSSTPVSAYRLMQNSASLSALMARMAQSTPEQSAGENNASTPGEAGPQSPTFGGNKNDHGYIHIKSGMPCLRQDCKYAHQNHWHCTINRCRYVCKSLGKAQTHRQAHDSLDAYARSAKECFKSYSVKKQCPNPNCEFRLRGHYHCLKPGCVFATIGTSKLPWHMKKHEKIARREASGFKYFTKKEQCHHHDCKYNGNFSHYHCVRKGCTFAFQYKHQMSTHVRKHIRRMLGRTYAMGEDVQDIDHTNVDSGDDSLPLIIDEVEEAEQRPGPSALEEQRGRDQLSQQQMEVLERMTQQMKSSYPALQQGLASENENMEGERAVDQIPRATDNEDSNSDDNSIEHYGALDLSSLAAGSSKSNDSVAQQHAQDLESMNEDSMSNGMENSTDEAEMNMAAENDDGTPACHSPLSKASREAGQFNKFKIGDSILDGFRRFETNENCGDEKCAYAYKVAHYHCTRDNCNYHFTGRSHMFKHQQHHDRVAGLVRDDFKRFKATHPCEDEHCEYKGKNTHFHCLRCSFKCTDSAKVGTHRRQHMKADTLEQSGFQRIKGKDDCGREDCKYRFRNMSHFHCLQPGCNYTIVGLTGIELHAEKHKRGLLQPTTNRHVESANLIMQNLAAFRSMQQQMLGTSVTPSTPDDGGIAHNLSLQTLAAFREMQNQMNTYAPPTPTSPAGQSENGHSNQSSPFLLPPQGEPGHLLSRFAFLSSANATQAPMVAPSSPVTSTAISMVTEGVGS